MIVLPTYNYSPRLPRLLKASPLRMGDEILEINGVPVVDQDQKEVAVSIHVYTYIIHIHSTYFIWIA